MIRMVSRVWSLIGAPGAVLARNPDGTRLRSISICF
jgi:hypothetical protein